MDDQRRLKDLRAQVRASYYCCRCELARTQDEQVRAVLENAALARWRLARAIDAFLLSLPAPLRSRLQATLRDRAACFVRRVNSMLALDAERRALRWLANDSATLRHSVEISRALTWSLEISDLLSARLAELKQSQRAIAKLRETRPGRGRRTRPARALATT